MDFFIKWNCIVVQLLMLAILPMGCSSSDDSGGRENPKVPETPTPPPTTKNEMDFWMTKGDRSVLLKKQSDILGFGTAANNFQNITVNEDQTFQTIDGFGFTLTGGSAMVINQMTASKKQELLRELFGKGDNDVAISYLRLSIGASDLDPAPYSYNDLDPGETDLNLEHFSLAADKSGVVPLLKEILAINPDIKIMATPWSPPVWMKDNGSTIGGSLQEKYYSVYADYFVRYIQEMKKEGIVIDAITPQNEPLHPGNNPSMLMLASEQANFIKTALGPAFKDAGLTTKIVAYDHNCDKPEYPMAVLNDAGANPFVNGSAFHLYAGDISAMTTVHNAFPEKDLYFTEQYTASTGEFQGDLKWHVKNVIIGSMRNWSKTALEWNLANDSSFQPHTDGGCTTCKGAITVNSTESFIRNVGYYIVAHASKFVPQGSVRIGSNIAGNLQNVAFRTPEGKLVLIVENDGANGESFNIKYKDKWVTTSLDAGSVGTYVWE